MVAKRGKRLITRRNARARVNCQLASFRFAGEVHPVGAKSFQRFAIQMSQRQTRRICRARGGNSLYVPSFPRDWQMPEISETQPGNDSCETSERNSRARETHRAWLLAGKNSLNSCITTERLMARSGRIPHRQPEYTEVFRLIRGRDHGIPREGNSAVVLFHQRAVSICESSRCVPADK